MASTLRCGWFKAPQDPNPGTVRVASFKDVWPKLSNASALTLESFWAYIVFWSPLTAYRFSSFHPIIRIIPAPFFIFIRTIWLFFAQWSFILRIRLHDVCCLIRMPRGKWSLYWPILRIRWHSISILIRTSARSIGIIIDKNVVPGI